ncbi:EamA family transporter [Bradyrhizobium elkanii]|uniref:EamA family transporter n=2 Tax=Nitrobacteraceae TaxID=41294 RepID=UPI002FEF77D0
MDTTQRDRTVGFLCLVVTALGWALNWPLMKLLLQQWPPLFARGLAGTCAAVILATLALARRHRRQRACCWCRSSAWCRPRSFLVSRWGYARSAPWR